MTASVFVVTKAFVFRWRHSDYSGFHPFDWLEKRKRFSKGLSVRAKTNVPFCSTYFSRQAWCRNRTFLLNRHKIKTALSAPYPKKLYRDQLIYGSQLNWPCSDFNCTVILVRKTEPNSEVLSDYNLAALRRSSQANHGTGMVLQFNLLTV